MPKSKTESAPRAKTAAPRKTKAARSSARAKKTAATIVTPTVAAAPVVTYSYATDVARASHAASAMPALELFENQAAPAPAVAVAFVTFPGLDDAQKKLSETLKGFMERVGGAINEAATLKVKTYVSDDIEGIRLNAQGEMEGDLRLRAMTSIDLDGDIVAVIPIRPDGMDETLWAAHVDMVQQAQANRAELVKLAISTVSGLITAIKPG